MKRRWTIERHDGADKYFQIIGPSDTIIEITIDYDDVDHKQVDKEARELVKVLNGHWRASDAI